MENKNNTLENVAHPICPLNMWFKGDEDKIDLNKCDFRNRGCGTTCTKAKEGDWWYDEDFIYKAVSDNECKEFGFPISKYKHFSIHTADGLFVAYCGCHDRTLLHVLRILKCVNGWDALVDRCGKLGVERDVALGELDQLKTICTLLIGRASCMLQSHQCADHPDGDCSDRTYMQDVIKEAKTLVTQIPESDQKNQQKCDKCGRGDGK